MTPIGFVPGLKQIVYGLSTLTIGLVLIFLSSYFNMILFKTLGWLTIIVSIFPFSLGIYRYIHFKVFGPTYTQKVSNETFMDIVLRCMLSIAMNNRHPRNVDVYRIKRVYKLVFDYELSTDIVYDISEKMYSDSFNLQNFLRNKFRFIERPLRINVFKACYLVCHDNKQISDVEEKILFEIGRLLNISRNHINAAIREINLAKVDRI